MMEPVGVEKTNQLLNRFQADTLFVFLTGASGAGKFSLTKALEPQLNKERTQLAYFDSVGVPSVEEMVRTHGSGEAWQEATTHQWIEKLATVKEKGLIVLEGQYHPRFAVEGCRRAGITNSYL